MRKVAMSSVAFVVLLTWVAIAQNPNYQIGLTTDVLPQDRKAMDVYFVDTEGGQATLLVAPTGDSMLIDTGSMGNNDRDLNRILAVLKEARVEVLDYLVVTHYHGDHVGNAAALSSKLPIRNYIDHGPYSVELQPNRSAAFNAYLPVREKAKARQAKAGETISLGGVVVHVVSSSGELTKVALPGAGAPNALCRDFVPRAQDATPENFETIALVVRFGNFKLLDLADLTWNQERDLVCPNNLLGPMDVYHTTGHGTDRAGTPTMVHAIRPRVAIMNNSATKGGTPRTFTIVGSSPGLEDFWQLHFSQNVEKERNSPEQFIANLEGTPDHTAHNIKLTARSDGSFVMSNTRNGFTKEYPAHSAAKGKTNNE